MKNHEKRTKTTAPQAQSSQPESISMHDNVPVWYDCCSCEAEPYWVQAFEDAGSDCHDQNKLDEPGDAST